MCVPAVHFAIQQPPVEQNNSVNPNREYQIIDLAFKKYSIFRWPYKTSYNYNEGKSALALSMAREEAWAWCMAGAKGLSLLTATDLAAGT
jgi:hypothetical protein